MEWLVKHGYVIRETNYRKRYGEIDIIAEKSANIHFVEVKASKYYQNSAFSPEIRVNSRKIRKLRAICETYLFEKGLPSEQTWQIDVISVILTGDGKICVNMYENAVFGHKY